MAFVAVSEWAASLGMSRQAGHQAVKRCRIPLEGGKVDAGVATVLYQQRTRARARQNRAVGADQPAVGATVPTSGAGAPVGPESGAGAAPTQLGYQDARTRREHAEAEMAELEAARQAGRLLEREPTERAVFEAFRTVRDAVFAACRSQAPLVIGLTEVREVTLLLEDGMRSAFADFESKMQHKLRPEASA